MKKTPTPTPPAAKLQRNPRPLLRAALIVAAFILTFIILDLITKQFEELPGIVAWYPPAGLTYTLLLVFGVRFSPAVTIALFISSLFIYRMPQPPYALFLWAFIMSLIYSGAAAFLRHRIRFDWQLRKLRDVTWFVFTTVFVSALLAVLSVSSSALSSAMPRSEVFRAIFHWWIGETVGVLTVTPFLLIYVMPGLKRFAEGGPLRSPAGWSFPRPTLSAIGQISSIALTLYWVFGARVLDEFHPLFLIALPLIWIALQRGFKGVSAAILALNSGVVLALWLFRFDIARLGELELLMIVICIVGLLMGAIVTERKQAEEFLSESRTQLAGIISSAMDAIITVDAQQLIIGFNTAAEKIFGYPAANAIGQPLALLVPEGFRAAHVEQFDGFANNGVTTRMKENLPTLAGVRANGDEFPVEISISRVEIDGKKLYTAIIRDITEHKRTEEALRKSEIQFRTIFDSASDGILLADMETRRFFLSNRAICQMLGYTHAEMSVLGVDEIHPLEHLPYVLEQFNRQARGEIELAKSLPVQRKDGSVFYADVNAAQVMVGERPYLMGIFHDISERKRAEDDLRRNLDRARQSRQAMLSALEDQKRAEEEIQRRADELTALYDLSRALADMDDFNNILSLTVHHLVQSCQVTFARALLVEGDEFVVRAAFPIRDLPRELQIGQHESVAALSFCQHALEQSDPIIVRATDPEITDLERQFLFLDMAQTLCLVPWRISETQRGLWILDEAREEKREPFTAGKLRLIGSIIEQVNGALQRAKLREQTKGQLSQLQALHNIDTSISSSMDLRVTLEILLKHVTTQLKVDAADVLLFNPHSRMLEYAAGCGFRGRAVERTRLRIGEGQAGLAALEQRMIQHPDFAASGFVFAQAELLAAENVAAYFAQPLMAKGEVKGVLEVFHRAIFHPGLEWLNFLETLAGQAAIAVDSAQLYEDLQRSNTDLLNAYDKTIEGWSHALDLRDKETEGHSQRVTMMTLKLARASGMTEAELVHVRHGALLHDIGKMGVPDHILLKPGKLTDEEWVAMRKHPQLAYELLSPIAYLRDALDIPYCHHEKWDGTGYPRGLKGEQIPLAARLFAIVDVWDALRSNRLYRQGWPKEKVIKHIKSLSGTHFDPAVVAVFLEAMAAAPKKKKT